MSVYAILIELSFIMLIGYACITDIKSFHIPNGVSLALLGLFFLYVVMLPSKSDVTSHLIAGLTVFCVTFVFYFKGWMGAGDVKLISVITLWAGPEHAFQFLTLMSLIGGGLAACLLFISRRLARDPGFARLIPSRRLLGWARRGIFPYGVAICTAALGLTPSIFR